MNKEVLINIKGSQSVEGESEDVELFTTGTYRHEDGRRFIAYDESEATGFEGSRTVVELADDLSRVSMTRSGATRSELVVEKGVRHQCDYDTGYGSVIIGVLGTGIRSTLGEEGGMLEFSYSLDINTSLVSENSVFITVKPAEH